MQNVVKSGINEYPIASALHASAENVKELWIWGFYSAKGETLGATNARINWGENACFSRLDSNQSFCAWWGIANF